MRRLLLSLTLLFPVGVAFAEPEGLSGVLEQSSATSPEQKQAFATDALAEIDGSVKMVEKLLADEEKRKEKNTEAIECLQRKLTPLRTLLDVASQSVGALSAAVGSSDVVHADQEYRKVAVALSKARDFLAEAQACVGDAGAREGENEVALDDGELGAEPPLADDVPIDVLPASPN
jgi:hypothetical protein